MRSGFFTHDVDLSNNNTQFAPSSHLSEMDDRRAAALQVLVCFVAFDHSFIIPLIRVFSELTKYIETSWHAALR